MEFKGTKGKWVVDGGDIMCTNRPNRDSDVCIFMSLTTEYKNEDLYNKNLVSHAPELLDFINRISGEMLRNDFVLDEKWYDKANDLLTRATTI